MSHIKVGVIGVGRMGEQHCRVYSNLRQAELAGVFDTNQQLASRVAQKYETVAYPSVDQLLDCVDAVSITTPTPPHFSLAMECIQRGIHFLIEKPMTETLEQADHLNQAAKACNLVIQVGHIERFNPAYLELRNVLEHMPALTMHFRRLSPFKGSNTDVDVVLDLMTHDVDLILDLVKQQPIRVNATAIKVFSQNFDHAVAQLIFPATPIVTLAASRITEQKIRSIAVSARDAYLEADLLNKTLLVHRRTTGEYLNPNHSSVKYRHESLVERILVPNIEPLYNEIQHFVQCTIDGKQPIVTTQDGFNALRLVMEIRNQITECEIAAISNPI